MGITIYECEPDEAALFREMAPRLGITPTITDVPLSETTSKLAYGNKCISVSHKTCVTPSILRALSRVGVEYISTRSGGYNHIDVGFARSVGIAVRNVAYSPDSVADYTVMLILMMLRGMPSIMSRAGTHDFRLPAIRGKELRDMTVGVIGTGHIGATVITRLEGFGCRVIAYDHHPKTTTQYVPLDNLLRQSDIITLHMPLTPETHHFLDRERLILIKCGAFIVNTGRGSLIDTDALIEALETSKLGGAALDVLEGEEELFYADYRKKPIENTQLLRLQKMPNVILTPHVAYYTNHALNDIVENTLVNCLNVTSEKEKTV